jgi:FkbM family methyltransferase
MDIRDSNNNIIDINNIEKQEQDLVNIFIMPNDIVLELGARYGSVSCCINQKLINKNNQVVVEPDERVWDGLEKNKIRNNCKFNIVNGFISNIKLGLTNLDIHFGYGTTFELNDNSKIPCYTLEEIQNNYNLNFNVLIADCEGFLETFFDENPNFYDQLKLIIFEADYSEKCNYDKIKEKLLQKNFLKILEGHQNVWISKNYIEEYKNILELVNPTYKKIYSINNINNINTFKRIEYTKKKNFKLTNLVVNIYV